jgi:hypothetical protein
LGTKITAAVILKDDRKIIVKADARAPSPGVGSSA